MTEFNKDNAKKARWSGLSRLPGRDALLNTIERNDVGARQYGDTNWANGTREVYLDALMRHVWALLDGEVFDVLDPDGQNVTLTHYDAIIWNALVLSDPRLGFGTGVDPKTEAQADPNKRMRDAWNAMTAHRIELSAGPSGDMVPTDARAWAWGHPSVPPKT